MYLYLVVVLHLNMNRYLARDEGAMHNCIWHPCIFTLSKCTYSVVVLHLNMNWYLARADGAVAVADHGDLLRLGQGGGDLSSYFGQHLHKKNIQGFFCKGSRNTGSTF